MAFDPDAWLNNRKAGAGNPEPVSPESVKAPSPLIETDPGETKPFDPDAWLKKRKEPVAPSPDTPTDDRSTWDGKKLEDFANATPDHVYSPEEFKKVHQYGKTKSLGTKAGEVVSGIGGGIASVADTAGQAVREMVTENPLVQAPGRIAKDGPLKGSVDTLQGIVDLPKKMVSTALEGASRGTYDIGAMGSQMVMNPFWLKGLADEKLMSEDDATSAAYTRYLASKESQQLRQKGFDGSGNLNPLKVVTDPILGKPLEKTAEASSYILDPTMIAGGATAPLKAAMKGAAKETLIKAVGKETAENIAAGAAKLPKNAVAAPLNAVGSVVKGVGDAASWIRSLPRKLAEKVTENKDIQGALGAGGAIGTGIIAPEILSKTGQTMKDVAAAIRQSGGSQKFFESMEREAISRGNKAAAEAYRLLDKFGASRAVSGAKRIAESGATGAVVGAGLGAAAGMDAKQIGESIGAGGALGAAGGGIMEPGAEGRADVVKGRQANDARWLLRDSKYSPDANRLLEAQAAGYEAAIRAARPDMSDAEVTKNASELATEAIAGVAAYARTNPDINFEFTEDQIGGGQHYLSEDQNKSNIKINIHSPNLLNKVIGHEVLHHIASTGKRDVLIGSMLGDPLIGKDGLLKKAGPDGKFSDTPFFADFKAKYLGGLDASYQKAIDAANASGDGKRAAQLQAQWDQSKKHYSNDVAMAEEVLGEVAGSLLGGRTRQGELNYNRIRRSGADSTFFDRIAGRGDASGVDVGFGDSIRLPLKELLSPEIKSTLSDYISSKEAIRRDPKFEFDSDQRESVAYTKDWIKSNPAVAQKIFGSDPGFKWEKDKSGSVTGVKILTEAAREKASKEAAGEVVKEIAKNPGKVNVETRMDKDGKTETVIKDMPDEVIDELAKGNMWSPEQIAKFKQVMGFVKNNSGEGLRLFYQPATKGNKYATRSVGAYDVAPYETYISTPKDGKGQNILIRALDINQVEKNFNSANDLLAKRGESSPYANTEAALADLQVMLENHKRGRGAMGNEIPGTVPKDAPATRPDGSSLSEAQRNYLNLILGADSTDGMAANPLRASVSDVDGNVGRRTKGVSSAIKQFRFDRINSFQPTDLGKFPTNWRSMRFNLRPDEAGKSPSFRPDESKDFYSVLSRTLEDKMPNKASVAQIQGILRGSQVKPDELKWSSLDGFLEGKETVSKQEVLDYLADEGAVRFSERRLDDDPKLAEEPWNPGENLDSDYPTKYAQYVLPGGENYRELVLTMPKKFKSVIDIASEMARADGHDYNALDADSRGDYQRFAALKQSNVDDKYTSSHFEGIPNYVSHMRVNDRIDSEGSPGLFIEEIQSDRFQQGRKKGIKGDDHVGGKKVDRVRVQGVEYSHVMTPTGLVSIKDTKGKSDAEVLKEVNSEVDKTAVPDAPYRKDWPVQMFKRGLRDAISSGKEWIGFTTGSTQSDRFDMSKKVSTIRYSQGADGSYNLNVLPIESGSSWQRIGHKVKESELSDYVGKEVASKIAAKEGVKDTVTGDINLMGDDLKLTSGGMGAFYDQILPKEIGKYVKKWGGKVEKGSLEAPQTSGSGDSGRLQFEVFDPQGQMYDAFPDETLAKEAAEDAGPGYTVKSPNVKENISFWKIAITPEMRQSIQKEGQPLFRPDEEVTHPEQAQTLSNQLELVTSGKRKAMLVPKGNEDSVSEQAKSSGLQKVLTPVGVFYFDPKKTSRKEIRDAVKNNKVGDILEYGISSKPSPDKTVGIVAVRGQDGTEIQAVATDKENAPQVLQRAKAVAKEGDSIGLEHPEETLRGRGKWLANRRKLQAA